MKMAINDEYLRICPNCGDLFDANHISRIYCSETCKRQAFRIKKQQEREEKTEGKEAIEFDDLKLEELFKKGEIEITKTDLDEVKFIPNGYDRRYRIDSFIFYTFKNYALLEMQNRNFRICKSF